jgi:hypothetical protein
MVISNPARAGKETAAAHVPEFWEFPELWAAPELWAVPQHAPAASRMSVQRRSRVMSVSTVRARELFPNTEMFRFVPEG